MHRELVVDCHGGEGSFAPQILQQVAVEQHATHHVEDGVVEVFSDSVVLQCVGGDSLMDDAVLEE